MLNRLRDRLEGYLMSLGKVFGSTGIGPTSWSMVGLMAALASGYAYSSSDRSGELTGGVLLLASGFFDIVDGAVAKVMGKTSKRGAFLDSTFDRVAEVAVFAGILAGAYAEGGPILLSLSFSLLVSYTRARGESLGTNLSGVGVGERSERILVLSMASIAGLTGWGVLAVLILAGFTFLERTYRASNSLA